MSKVLIVEDEEAIADIEKDYLELSGFTVTTCKDGTTGLAEALDGDYDIYILDVMLVNSAQPENDIIEIRGIRIDKTARRVFVNGEEKIFTTKEFDLLTFLAEHPNHVYTKEELFKEIWDMDSIGDIATVTVHIKKIREKIELDTSKPQYIETIWGVGYRFKL